MKKSSILLLAAIIIFSSFESYSQVNVKIKKRSYNAIGAIDGHYSGYGLGYSGLVGGLGSLSLPAEAKFMNQKSNSVAFDFNPIDITLPLGRRMGFVTGLGLEVNNFKFDDNISLKQNDDGYIVAEDYNERGIDLQKSKLVNTYLNIPILFEVQFGSNNDFFVNFGAIGGLRLQSHTKVKADHQELNGKYKKHKGLNVRNFHYGYMVQMGYKSVGLYAKYYPQSIFKSGMGPEVEQVNIGLMIYIQNKSIKKCFRSTRFIF